jgi:hypothetical protein
VCQIYLCVSSNILLWRLSMLLYYLRDTVQNNQIRDLNKIPPPENRRGNRAHRVAHYCRGIQEQAAFLNVNSCFVFYLSITLWVDGSQGPNKPVLQIKTRNWFVSLWLTQINNIRSFLFDWRKLTIFTTTRRQEFFSRMHVGIDSKRTSKSIHACANIVHRTNYLCKYCKHTSTKRLSTSQGFRMKQLLIC